MSEKLLKFILMSFFCFLGSVFSSAVLFHLNAAFADTQRAQDYFAVYDQANKKGLEAFVHQGYPTQNFYARDGKIRLQQSVYSEKGSEGLPMIGMYDNHSRMKMLFRLAGKNESPVIIMKDNQQKNRFIFGLDLSGEEQAPFMAVFDSKGQKQVLFGKY